LKWSDVSVSETEVQIIVLGLANQYKARSVSEFSARESNLGVGLGMRMGGGQIPRTSYLLQQLAVLIAEKSASRAGGS
jgi:hypothetical protein